MPINSKPFYYPSLDGLRALSIIAVILFHADSLWLAGGFLGVETFFVISGFIITTLLLDEWRAGQALDLARFWRHRCRRLLPGMITTVLVTAWVVAVRYPEEWGQVREDILPGLTFTSNWFYILNERSYFDLAGRPRLYEHLWSLAVEFQYYLLWPVICLALFRFGRAFGMAFCLVGAALASSWMAYAYLPDADPTRLYFGTDTRLGGLLIGSAAAFGMPLSQRANKIPATFMTTCIADLAAALALLGLLALFVWMDEMQPVLYRGGFAAVAVSTALCIRLSIIHNQGLIAALLGAKPLTFIGLRAYNIYLWHWPVFCLTQPWVDIPLDGVALFALRLGVIGVLSEISYRCIDTPIRRGWLTAQWQKNRQKPRFRAALASGSVIAAVCIAVLFTDSGIFRVASARSVAAEQAELLGIDVDAMIVPHSPGEQGNKVAAVVVTPDSDIAQSAVSPDTLAPLADAPDAVPPPPMPALPWVFTPGYELITYTDFDLWQEYIPPAMTIPGDGVEGPTVYPPPGEKSGGDAGTGVCYAAGSVENPAKPALDFKVKTRETEHGPYIVRVYPAEEDKRQVFAIGDSVMLGAANQLWRTIGDIDVDAQVGRQLAAGTALLADRKRRDLLADTVIVHLGNNSPINARQLTELLEVLKDTQRVMLINLKVPRPYEAANNSLLSAASLSYPNVTVVDWRGPSLTESKVFARDGMHLTGEGVRLYTRLISQTLCGARYNGRPFPEPPKAAQASAG